MTADNLSPFVPKLRFPEFLGGWTWDELTIGGVCDLKAGDFIPASEIAEHPDEGSFRCYGGNGFRGYVKSFTHEGRYVLVGRQGALCGNVNLYAGKFHATEHALVATPKPGIDTGWLFYALDVLKLNRFSIGQAQPGLSVGVLRDVGISVPIGEAEQQKIADCLGSLDDLTVAEGRNLEGLREHKQGLMQQLFPQPAETVTRLRFPEFLNKPIWDELTIDDVCDLKAGDFIPASEIAEHADEGSFPCYGGNGLRGYVKSFTHEGRYVLVGRQGALCGNVNLYAGKFHATEHALVAAPKPGIDTGWLFYALDVLKLNRFAIGQAQPGLSVAVLRDVGISVPVEEDEQQKIADCLGSLDDLIAAESRKLETLRQHKQGLMQQLFPSREAV